MAEARGAGRFLPRAAVCVDVRGSGKRRGQRAEGFFIAAAELVVAEVVGLRAELLDGVAGAHRADLGRLGHGEPAGKTLEQAGAMAVARAGGVLHVLAGNGRDVHVHALRVADALALGSEGGHQPAGELEELLLALARGLADHADLVIVGDAGIRAGDGVQQISGAEDGELLAGVIDVADALFPEEARQAAHILQIAG